MNTSELTGALLDYWVARAEGIERKDIFWRAGGDFWTWGHDYGYSPSSSWAQGGPIIERECIGTTGPGPMGPAGGDMSKTWSAHIDTGSFPGIGAVGPTPLIAAMRAYVASKFGDTVPDEVAA